MLLNPTDLAFKMLKMKYVYAVNNFDLDTLVPAPLVIPSLYGFVIAVGCNSFLPKPRLQYSKGNYFSHDSDCLSVLLGALWKYFAQTF